MLYIPRADVDMTRWAKTDHSTTCPQKGKCSHYSVKTDRGMLENAMWPYETPISRPVAIAGHLAPYPDKVTLA